MQSSQYSDILQLYHKVHLHFQTNFYISIFVVEKLDNLHWQSRPHRAVLFFLPVMGVHTVFTPLIYSRLSSIDTSGKQKVC